MTVKIETLRLKLKQLDKELMALRPSRWNCCPGGRFGKRQPVHVRNRGERDVGKTTLINHQRGARISIDTDILDEGTSIAVAYAYEDDLQILKTPRPAWVDESNINP